MASNYDIAFGLGRKIGRTLFKQDGIYYADTNVFIRMFSDGRLVVLPKIAISVQSLYKCPNILVTSFFRQKSL
jgi:hypothetical protein